MCGVPKVGQEEKLPVSADAGCTLAKCCGRRFSCTFDTRTTAGVVALVLAAVAFIFAVVLATGLFGGGKMAFIAGGLTIASMVGFGAAAVLILRPPKVQLAHPNAR